MTEGLGYCKVVKDPVLSGPGALLMGYRQMYGDVNTVSVLSSLDFVFQKFVLVALLWSIPES